MARDRIVFAMANPVPEIMPEEAEPYVRVMATGRSDYPNQINNVLCFPGFFRGLLDSRARERQRRDEAGRGARHRVVRGQVASSGPSTSSRACSTRTWRRRWRVRWCAPPRRPGWRAGARAPTATPGSEPPRVASPTALRWSVVIPAYNEANRLPRYLREVVRYFDGRDEPYEVLVVDDGSTDDTAARGARVTRRAPVRWRSSASSQPRQGARGARRDAPARGALRLMADADGATPIGEVKRLETAILARGRPRGGLARACADPSVVVRAHAAPATVRARVHLDRAGPRRAAGGGHPVRLQALPGRGRGRALRRAPHRRVRLRRGAAAPAPERRGYRIVEVAVNWADQPGSKVGVLTDGPRMLARDRSRRAAARRQPTRRRPS